MVGLTLFLPGGVFATPLRFFQDFSETVPFSILKFSDFSQMVIADIFGLIHFFVSFLVWAVEGHFFCIYFRIWIKKWWFSKFFEKFSSHFQLKLRYWLQICKNTTKIEKKFFLTFLVYLRTIFRKFWKKFWIFFFQWGVYSY